RLDAEGRLGALARAAPDVRVADEGEGGGEDAALPRRQRRENERRGRGLDGGNLAAAEAEDARRGISRLGPGGGVGGAELEVVLGGGVVVSKAEQASRDFGAEAARRAQAGGPRRPDEVACCGGEAEAAHELGVGARDGD